MDDLQPRLAPRSKASSDVSAPSAALADPAATPSLTLFLSHRAALIECAARHVGSAAWAEDVVQEAYLRFAAASENSAANIQRPLGYLRRIVRNLAIDWSHHLYPESRQLPEPLSNDVASPARSLPEAEALSREDLRLVSRALAELPQRERRAFELRHFDELTLDEIHATLGISISLAHKLVQNAVSHCAASLRQAHSVC